MIRLMRALLLIALFFPAAVMAETAPIPYPWVKVTETYVSPLQVRMWGPTDYSTPEPWTGLYYRGGDLPDPYPSPELVGGTVYTMDLTPFGVASDATVAFLSGILIVTMGESKQLGEIRVTMGRNGDPLDCTKYLGQAATYNAPYQNVRSNMSTFVPLRDGKFDFCIIKGTANGPVSGVTYGINLTLEMWGR